MNRGKKLSLSYPLLFEKLLIFLNESEKLFDFYPACHYYVIIMIYL